MFVYLIRSDEGDTVFLDERRMGTNLTQTEQQDENLRVVSSKGDMSIFALDDIRKNLLQNRACSQVSIKISLSSGFHLQKLCERDGEGN
jgi:hypothetical protein